ncbi:brachyurin-like [Periplaneta americana]|uniref:brachyurin-like n=1 Tax=Periplaneta americana TaxID=6978 RepID=UPI0037E8E8BA
MKTFVALALLATFGLMAEALQSRNIVMPINPRYTAEEWRTIMAAQLESPEQYPGFKKGSEPQPAFAGKVHVHDVSSRITNGQIASRGQFPWQVALLVDNSWFCGGSVISNQWVLTAAHCAGSSYQVILGANNYYSPESGSVTVTTRSSIRHENYNSDTINNDIAVVKLQSPVSFSTYISPVRLPTRSQQGDTLAGETVRVSGWGKISDSASSVTDQLRFVDLTVITNSVCAGTYGSVITSSKLCVSTPGGRSTCSGDSGGPLVHLESSGVYTEVGIVSFGAAAGCELGYPAAFTRVTSYLDWIETNTGISIG